MHPRRESLRLLVLVLVLWGVGRPPLAVSALVPRPEAPAATTEARINDGGGIKKQFALCSNVPPPPRFEMSRI